MRMKTSEAGYRKARRSESVLTRPRSVGVLNWGADYCRWSPETRRLFVSAICRDTQGEDNHDIKIRFVGRPGAGRALWKTQGCYRHRCVERDRPRDGEKAGLGWLPRGCQLTQCYIC